MSNYLIIISAVGYETVEFAVAAPTLAIAKKSEGRALAEWIAANNVATSDSGLAFIKYRKV